MDSWHVLLACLVVALSSAATLLLAAYLEERTQSAELRRELAAAQAERGTAVGVMAALLRGEARRDPARN